MTSDTSTESVPEARIPANTGRASLLGDNPATVVFSVDSNCRVTAAHVSSDSVPLWAKRLQPSTHAVLPSVLRELLRGALATGTALRDREILLADPATPSGLFRLSIVPTRDGDSAITGAVVMLTGQNSPAHILDQNLGHLERLASIGTLAASMAHEIKNALVAMRTFVDLLVARNKDSELATIVGREVHRINSLVSQMLHFSGPARPVLGEVHLHEQLDHSLNLIQHHMEGRHIRLERQFQAESDGVSADAYQLEQLFLNLLFNAIDAMGTHGVLSVATQLIHPDGGDSPVVRLSVSDTGVGISPEHLPRLFEPFFTTKPSGTGLGLAIARRIVQEHRGDIQVQSKHGEGTTFIVDLPSAARQP